MEIYLFLVDFLFQYQAWIILGIILIIADIWAGFDIIILPIGVAALLLATMLYGETHEVFGDSELFTSWRIVLIWFAGLSIVSVVLIRIFLQRSRKGDPDINKY